MFGEMCQCQMLDPIINVQCNNIIYKNGYVKIQIDLCMSN